MPYSAKKSSEPAIATVWYSPGAIEAPSGKRAWKSPKPPPPASAPVTML